MPSEELCPDCAAARACEECGLWECDYCLDYEPDCYFGWDLVYDVPSVKECEGCGKRVCKGCGASCKWCEGLWCRHENIRWYTCRRCDYYHWENGEVCEPCARGTDLRCEQCKRALEEIEIRKWQEVGP